MYIYVWLFYFIYILIHIYIYKSTKCLCFFLAFFCLSLFSLQLCTNLSKRFLPLVFRVLYCECIFFVVLYVCRYIDFETTLIENPSCITSTSRSAEWSEVRCGACRLALPLSASLSTAICCMDYYRLSIVLISVVAVVRSLFKVLKCFCLNFHFSGKFRYTHTHTAHTCLLCTCACMYV